MERSHRVCPLSSSVNFPAKWKRGFTRRGMLKLLPREWPESHWDTPATCRAWLPWGPLEGQESHFQRSPRHPPSVLVWTILHKVTLPLYSLCRPVCLSVCLLPERQGPQVSNMYTPKDGSAQASSCPHHKLCQLLLLSSPLGLSCLCSHTHSFWGSPVCAVGLGKSTHVFCLY